MNVGVLLHVGLLVEPLAAVLARVRPRVRVDEEVRRQRGAPLEGLAALLARERPLVVVDRSGGETTEENQVASFCGHPERAGSPLVPNPSL